MFEFEDITDAVLVGHSYGGFVITGAMEQIADRVRSIVFLDGAALGRVDARHRRSRPSAAGARTGRAGAHDVMVTEPERLVRLLLEEMDASVTSTTVREAIGTSDR